MFLVIICRFVPKGLHPSNPAQATGMERSVGERRRATNPRGAGKAFHDAGSALAAKGRRRIKAMSDDLIMRCKVFFWIIMEKYYNNFPLYHKK